VDFRSRRCSPCCCAFAGTLVKLASSRTHVCNIGRPYSKKYHTHYRYIECVSQPVCREFELPAEPHLVTCVTTGNILILGLCYCCLLTFSFKLLRVDFFAKHTHVYSRIHYTRDDQLVSRILALDESIFCLH
jgi:hypothetical protein